MKGFNLLIEIHVRQVNKLSALRKQNSMAYKMCVDLAAH